MLRKVIKGQDFKLFLTAIDVYTEFLEYVIRNRGAGLNFVETLDSDSFIDLEEGLRLLSLMSNDLIYWKMTWENYKSNSWLAETKTVLTAVVECSYPVTVYGDSSLDTDLLGEEILYSIRDDITDVDDITYDWRVD